MSRLVKLACSILTGKKYVMTVVSLLGLMVTTSVSAKIKTKKFSITKENRLFRKTQIRKKI